MIDELAGISTVAAATFVAELQDIDNFETESKLASYAGLGLSRRLAVKQGRRWTGIDRRCVPIAT